MSQTSSASSASSAHRQRSRTQRPAKDSLHHLLRQNAGIPLFARPLQWNDGHLRILGVEFCKLPPCNAPLPQYIAGSPPSKGHLRPSKAIRTLRDALDSLLGYNNLHPSLGAIPVKTVMSTLWPAAFGKSRLDASLPIVFGDYVYREVVGTQVMWLYPGHGVQSSQSSFRSISTRPAESNGLILSSAPTPHDPTDLPMMCYMGKEKLAKRRLKLYCIPIRPENNNEPVAQLQLRRLRALFPANSDHDAYLVAIFLAMAQRHFYAAPGPLCLEKPQLAPFEGKPPRPAFEDLKLRILSHDDDSAEFIIYTGYITCNFLDRFYDPYRVPTSEGDDDGALGIRIEYTKVPIWPILGLRERLGTALGEDIVGQFDASRMETWDDEPKHPIPWGTKRKREDVPEVFNESCEKDTDVDEQERRKLQEGPPIGVGA